MPHEPDRQERLKLYHAQDSLIEHKFPYDKIMIPEQQLSHAGDIYREVAGQDFPDGMYTGEKLHRLWVNLFDPQFKHDFFWAVKLERQSPKYIAGRDAYLKNLEKLFKMTGAAPIDQKRKSIMLATLKLQWALIKWYDSGSQSDYQAVRRSYDVVKMLLHMLYESRRRSKY